MGNPAKHDGNVGVASRVLFLDDMGWRHSEFTRHTDLLPGVRVWQAHTAAGAIALLSSQEFDQAFLDHDLSEEDIMVPVGGRSRVPTGMDVVDHILKMDRPPPQVVVHSCNGPAAIEMCQRLESHPAGISVKRVAFPWLIQLFRSLGSSA